MGLAGVGAGDKGVQPLDLVSKAVLDQKIQRPVGHGRLRAEPFFAQAVEDVIGAKRAVFLQQDFQHPAAYRGEFQAVGLTVSRDSVDTVLNAAVVIMWGKADGIHANHPLAQVVWLLICYAMTFINRVML